MAKGASATIRGHVSKCKTKGNRKPSTKRSSSQAGAANKVGGWSGASFDNASVGQR